MLDVCAQHHHAAVWPNLVLNAHKAQDNHLRVAAIAFGQLSQFLFGQKDHLGASGQRIPLRFPTFAVQLRADSFMLVPELQFETRFARVVMLAGEALVDVSRDLILRATFWAFALAISATIPSEAANIVPTLYQHTGWSDVTLSVANLLPNAFLSSSTL